MASEPTRAEMLARNFMYQAFGPKDERDRTPGLRDLEAVLAAAVEAETEALSARIKSTLDYVHSEMLHQWGHASQAHEEGDELECRMYAECGDRLHDVWVKLGGPEVERPDLPEPQREGLEG